MTDMELLERAARAAGMKVSDRPDGIMRDVTGLNPASNVYAAPHWNPLESDGDALRLAVRLGINVEPDVSGNARAYGENGAYAQEERGQDPFAATRRAIVRAAAELAPD